MATLDSSLCDGIARTPTGVINRFENQLTNVGGIDTDGWDFNVIYATPDYAVGQFTVAWTNTFVNSFDEELLASEGTVTRSLEGVEENDRGIPEWQSNLNVSWARGDWGAGWTLRFIDELDERCSDFLDGSPDSLANIGVCSSPDFNDNSQSMNELDSTIFNDFRGSYIPSALEGNLELTLGINNAFDEDPPDCYSCSLNGYDPSTYDVPGRFWYVSVLYRRQ